MRRIDTFIADLVILEPDVYGDERGFFYESYNEDTFRALGIETVFRQDNHSASAAGVLRGLHFQRQPKPMAKLVRVTKGEVWDCVVDLRRSSKTYLKWFGIELSATNKRMLFVPEGFAHGFYVLEDTEFLYKCSNTYEKTLDANVRYDDSQFGIDWRLKAPPILSARDEAAPSFASLESSLGF